ncbi:replication-relaxation family protein [Paenibacillus sp. S-38]|uniref:replication-relaxation family protein n=1 Tax=Paenibacillus sp. S-38 TaxID=3416710 RepID=UPI003CEC0F3B
MLASRKDERTKLVLSTLSTIPLMTTEQVGRLMFPEAGSPLKRASQLLRGLEEDKIVEGRRLGDMRKIWRLTRRGRAEAQTDKTAVPLNSPKIAHWLTIGDAYLQLQQTGMLRHLECELRIPYHYAGREYLFAPDCFLIWNRRAYLLEVQLSRLSREQWAKKWRRWNDYFGGNHYLQAPWQRFKQGGGVIPQPIILTEQSPELVLHGYAVVGRKPVVVSRIDGAIDH